MHQIESQIPRNVSPVQLVGNKHVCDCDSEDLK